jgi:hypothetical protein|tara:strand:- start:48 stop:404 length:357 start_codon:yes stop_codon:yes gene_type:complete
MDLSWILVLYDLLIFPFGVPRRILEFVLLFVSRLMNSQNMLGNEVYEEEEDEDDDDWINQIKEDGLNEDIFNFNEESNDTSQNNEDSEQNNDATQNNGDDDISLDDILNVSNNDDTTS